MLRFENRVGLLDLRSDKFLSTLVQIGGYCTIGQAKRLGLANSDTRALAHLRVFEENGFVRRVFSYPVVYQTTKAATRLLGKDRRARRLHNDKTVLNRLLAVDFYLEDAQNADFVFDHEKKIAVLTQRGCPLGMIPQRGGRPYLWDEFLLKVADGTITIAQVDDQGRGTFSQAKNLAIRFSEVTKYLPQYSSLSIVTGSEARERSYERVLRHPDMQQVHACCGIPVSTSLIDASVKSLANTNPYINSNVEQETARRHRRGGWSPNLARIEKANTNTNQSPAAAEPSQAASTITTGRTPFP